MGRQRALLDDGSRVFLSTAGGNARAQGPAPQSKPGEPVRANLCRTSPSTIGAASFCRNVPRRALGPVDPVARRH
ncbi:hypothetical protein M3J09_013152 [Ascochyta lentis]